MLSSFVHFENEGNKNSSSHAHFDEGVGVTVHLVATTCTAAMGTAGSGWNGKVAVELRREL